MKDLNDLRRERKAASDKMAAQAEAIEQLEAADTRDEEAIAAAVAEFEADEKAFKKADAAVKRAEACENAAAAAATGGDEAQTLTATQPAQAKQPGQEGIEAGFMVQALANSKGDRDRAVARLERDGHSRVAAALSGASDSAGGVTIPQAQSQEIIELLRPRIAVRASGARVIPMPAGELRNARQSGSATAGYGAENTATAPSEPTFDKVDKSFKKLSALVPIGNSLLRHSSAPMAIMVRDDLLDVMALREDLAFIRGDGAGDTPKGLKNWCPGVHWKASIAATAAAADAALRGVVSMVEDSNVAMLKPGWIMRASAKNFLASLRWPGTDMKVFPSIEANGTLLGYPIKTTSQIPTNLGVGGDETEIYFADFNEVVIGDTMAITIASSGEASYVDDQGDTISAFQNDLTLMRAISEHDLAPRHDVAIAGLNGVGWTL